MRCRCRLPAWRWIRAGPQDAEPRRPGELLQAADPHRATPAPGGAAPELLTQLEQVVVLRLSQLGLHPDRRKMAGPFHQHRAAAGIWSCGQQQLKLLVQRRSDQIEGAAGEQGRNRNPHRPVTGPEEAAETVHSHNPHQLGWRLGGGKIDCIELTLQQSRGAQRQIIQSFTASPLQTRLRAHTGRQQRGERSHGMPLLTAHREPEGCHRPGR